MREHQIPAAFCRNGLTVFVGWNPRKGGYFARLSGRSRADRLAFGASRLPLSSIHNIDELEQILEGLAVLPVSIRQKLIADRRRQRADPVADISAMLAAE